MILVGGAAVDFHTGGYTVTDIDLVGSVTKGDRRRLQDVGFVAVGSQHLRWDFPDGLSELVEFPDGVLDGDLMQIGLSDTVKINTITLESLVVDRILQATDRTLVNLEEAVRLVVADDVDWSRVSADITARPQHTALTSAVRRVLTAAGQESLADEWFATSGS